MYQTIELMKQAEEWFLYPPRFKIKCRQIDSTQPLYYSLKISKNRNKEEIADIGHFPLIKETTGTS